MTETTDSTSQPSDTRTVWAVLIAVVLVASFGLYSAFGDGSDSVVATDETDTRFESAKALTDWPASQYVKVRDGGYTLVVDGKGNDSPGADLETIVTVLLALNTPDSVTSRMDNTRALDGMQEANWDNLTATWTYHPDNGLDIVIEDRR